MSPPNKGYERVKALRGLRRDLRLLCRDLENEDIPSTVGSGAALWSLIADAQAHLDKVKATIRREVAGSEPGRQDIEAPDNDLCVVVIGRPRVVVRMDVDVDAIHESLGGDIWGRLFRMDRQGRLVATRDFIKEYEEIQPILTPDQTATIMAAIDIKTDPARVSFSKGRSK